MTKENFWPDAARGGVVVGLVVVAAMCLKVWTAAGFAASLIELAAVSWAIYAFTKRRGAQSYGQCMKFVLAMMLLAGVVYGAGYYFMVNYWAVDYFAQQFDLVSEAMGAPMDKDLLRAAVANPFYCVLSGVFAEVFYGGIVGLFVVAFIRKR
jgi:hypothetical protein